MPRHARQVHACCFRVPTGISRRCRAPMTPSRRSRSMISASTSIPIQMEIISSEQMLDAYSSVGMPLMYRHWSFGKHFLYRGTPLPQGPARPRLRARHQLQSLHRLPDGRKHHGHAGPGDRACRLRPQPFLQEQLPVPAVDRRRRHPELSGFRQELHHPLRGTAWHRRGGAYPRRRPRADGAGRVQVPPPAAALLGKGARRHSRATGI